MAEVYKARLPGVFGFEKIVVIKRLFPHLAKQPQMVEMFIGEAKLAAQVHHPNVVQVHELGQLGDEYFIVMELIDGTDLRRLLRRACERGIRIPPWFSVYVVSEVLDGLSYVHELRDPQGRLRNVVHRDVSPDNVFISCFGNVKLGDFGVAKDDLRGLEVFDGRVKGKLAYMAPEHLAGHPIDRRCDVFAAGVVLWECLAQKPLFGGTSTAETIISICQRKREAPSAYMDDVPEELDQVVLATLEIEANKRTPTARDLFAQLQELLPTLKARIGSADIRRAIDEITGGQVTPPRGTIISPATPVEDLVIDITLSGLEDQVVDQVVDQVSSSAGVVAGGASGASSGVTSPPSS